MRLRVLGSGTGVPSVRRASPAYLVRSGATTALVDSGPGALRELARAGLGPHDLTDLFYTHAHPDHTGDLWAFLFVSRNPALGVRPRPLRLHGAAGFFDFYRRVRAAMGAWAEPSGYDIEEVVHAGQPVALGEGLTVRGHAVPHLASSVAYRFECGARSLVLSGDTDLGGEIIEAALDADLLVLDCSTPDGQKLDGHLTPSGCAEVARRARVRRLLLTHFYPEAETVDRLAAVRAHWPGDCALAEDGLEIDLDEEPSAGTSGLAASNLSR